MLALSCFAALLSLGLMGCTSPIDGEVTEIPAAVGDGSSFTGFVATTKKATDADVMAAAEKMGRDSFAEKKVKVAEGDGNRDKKVLEDKAMAAAMGLVDTHQQRKATLKAHEEAELTKGHHKAAGNKHKFHDEKAAAKAALKAAVPSMKESVAAAQRFEEKGLPVEKNAYEKDLGEAQMGLALKEAFAKKKDSEMGAALHEAFEQKARAASMGLVEKTHKAKAAAAAPVASFAAASAGGAKADLDEHAREKAAVEQKAREASLGLVGERTHRQKAADAKAGALAAAVGSVEKLRPDRAGPAGLRDEPVPAH